MKKFSFLLSVLLTGILLSCTQDLLDPDTYKNAAEPAILTQPLDATVSKGAPVTLSVQAQSQDKGTLSYQWYQIDENDKERKICGEISDSLTLSFDETGNYQYFVRVTNTNCHTLANYKNYIDSNTVTVTVTPSPKIIYDSNKAKSGTAPEEQEKEYGTGLIISDNTGFLDRPGYYFNGWNERQDGTGTDYPAGFEYTEEASITLYAKWTSALHIKATGDDVKGNGTEENPYKTLSYVQSLIDSYDDSEESYIICIDGKISGPLSLSTTKASEITIRGIHENSDEDYADCLSRGENVLTVTTPVKTIIENIRISEGKKGLYITENADVTLKNIFITNNNGGSSGTALYIFGKCTFESGKISKNTATQDCAFRMNSKNAKFIMNGGEISENTANIVSGLSTGSGKFIMNAGKIVNNTTFITSSSSGYGTTLNAGGVWCCGYESFIMNGGLIAGNSFANTNHVTYFGSGVNGDVIISGDSVIAQNNEVYLREMGKDFITIAGPLTSEGLVAIIRPCVWQEGYRVLKETQEGLISEYYSRFTLTDSAWYIDETGCIHKKQ